MRRSHSCPDEPDEHPQDAAPCHPQRRQSCPANAGTSRCPSCRSYGSLGCDGCSSVSSLTSKCATEGCSACADGPLDARNAWRELHADSSHRTLTGYAQGQSSGLFSPFRRSTGTARGSRGKPYPRRRGLSGVRRLGLSGRGNEEGVGLLEVFRSYW